MARQNAQTDIADPARQAQALFMLNGAAAPQFEQFWQMQEGILKEFETFAQHWFERRHKATETAVEALHEISSTDGPDPVAAMQVMANWQRGSFERLTADFQEWMTLCMQATQLAATAQSEAASSDADQRKTTKTKGRPATSDSKSEHATPV